MALLRQSFLILFALILSVGQVFATSVTKEQRAYAAAVSAFQDGMWNRAETEFGQFENDYPNSTNAPMAVLLEAQAEFKQAKFTNAIAKLTDASNLAKAGVLADQYVYWAGEARFANSNFLAAAEIFSSLPQKFPESPLRLRAVVEASSAYMQLTNWSQMSVLLEETNGVFQRAAQLDPGNELVARGRLLLAQAKFALKDFGGAAAVLESLNSQTLKPELDWHRAYLLYQVKFATGDMGAALASTTNMLQIVPLENNGDLRAEGVALQAGILEKLGRASEAIAAYQENLTNNAPEEQQREAILKIAELSIAQRQSANAELKLENFLAQFTNSPATDVALLTLGELYLKDYVAQPAAATNQLQEAQACFDKFLGAFTNSPLAGKACLDRGWCEWLAEKYPESFNDFKSAAEKLLPSEDLAVARFKMGDALFAQNNFVGALTNYRAVLNDFSEYPAVVQTLGDRALYQSLRADLELGDTGSAGNMLAQIEKNDSTGEPAQTGGLLFGESLLDLHSPAGARAQFEKIVAQFPDSPLIPQVKLSIACTYESEQKWDAAIDKYESWLKNFPTNCLQPQADYALALANFQAGNETNAFAQFTNFVVQFPTNELAPRAQWWVADHYFRAPEPDHFVNAEKNYKYIFQNTNWQCSPLENRTNLFYPAQMMAGRAAVGRLGYSDAVGYFTSLVDDTNCPVDLRVQARFAWGGALMQMPSADTNNPLANFSAATNVFGQIDPTNELGALAQIEIGKCDLQLANFDAATNAYAQVFNSTNADISARSEAKIGFGLTLEKMAALATGTNQAALLELARGNYYDVFNASNLRGDELADDFWRKKAGLEAERLAEYFQEWQTAFDYYGDMTNNWPSLRPALENRMEKLSKEHHEAAQK
jgi:outer membrane protein assembly factor BamD (BamD/ComL family)